MSLSANNCDLGGIGGKPPPFCGQRFVVVHADGWKNLSSESLDERIGVAVTITDRIPLTPFDRLGTEELDEATNGLEAFAESVVPIMDRGQYDILDLANAMITDGLNTFVEPLRFRDGEQPTLQTGDWFNATHEQYAGLSVTLHFGEALRVRRIDDPYDIPSANLFLHEDGSGLVLREDDSQLSRES